LLKLLPLITGFKTNDFKNIAQLVELSVKQGTVLLLYYETECSEEIFLHYSAPVQ